MVSVVAYNPTTRAFTAEEPPAGAAEPELSIEALRLRVRQQELLADFGVLALKGTPFPQLLHEAAKVVADGLKAEFAKVLKYLLEQNKFLVCAGVGWDPGVVGVATIGADTASPAGYALQTDKAVISNHLDIEERFRTPELLLQYGIRRAMNVSLRGMVALLVYSRWIAARRENFVRATSYFFKALPTFSVWQLNVSGWK